MGTGTLNPDAKPFTQALCTRMRAARGPCRHRGAGIIILASWLDDLASSAMRPGPRYALPVSGRTTRGALIPYPGEWLPASCIEVRGTGFRVELHTVGPVSG